MSKSEALKSIKEIVDKIGDYIAKKGATLAIEVDFVMNALKNIVESEHNKNVGDEYYDIAFGIYNNVLKRCVDQGQPEKDIKLAYERIIILSENISVDMRFKAALAHHLKLMSFGQNKSGLVGADGKKI